MAPILFPKVLYWRPFGSKRLVPMGSFLTPILTIFTSVCLGAGTIIVMEWQHVSVAVGESAYPDPPLRAGTPCYLSFSSMTIQIPNASCSVCDSVNVHLYPHCCTLPGRDFSYTG